MIKVAPNTSITEVVNPRRDVRFWTHRATFAEYVDIDKMHGYEIGAFDLPMVEASEGRCQFADFRTTAELKSYAAEQPGHSADFVATVDYDLRHGYQAVPAGHDWVVAAHVVEHVPNLIGWLESIRDTLSPSGILFLVVPDKRYTFDIYRSETRIGEVFEAQNQKRVKPAYGHVFDHFCYHCSAVPADHVWSGRPIPYGAPNIGHALSAAERSLSEYVDVHCWVFTAQSFSELFTHLTEGGYISYDLLDVRPGRKGFLDFSAILRAKPSVS